MARNNPNAANDDVIGDFVLTMTELRRVTRYVVESAEPLLSLYEELVSGDDRPRRAIEIAHQFVEGSRRTNAQRMVSLDAHRAATAAPSELAKLAAQAAGDSASAAYLHPIRKGHQVAHILRAAANGIRIAEINAGDNSPEVLEGALEVAVQRADDELRSVLKRYPTAPTGRSRAVQIMCELDTMLRNS